MALLKEDILHMKKDLEHIHNDLEQVVKDLCRCKSQCNSFVELKTHVKELDSHFHDVLEHLGCIEGVYSENIVKGMGEAKSI